MTELQNAIHERLQRELDAKRRAEKRFAAEQYLIANRKSRNRSLALKLAIFVVCSVVMLDFVNKTQIKPASDGEILAKGEMTKAEIKALNIMPLTSEKRSKP